MIYHITIKYFVKIYLFFSLLFVSLGFSQVSYFETELPIVVIDTDNLEIPDEPKIFAHMGIIYNENGLINKSTDPFSNYDGTIGIEIRGASSQSFPKKSYGFETWDSDGNDIDVSLLGLSEEEDWILYGPYSDKTLIRNVLGYELSRQFGHYAARTKFCEVVLNTDYIGIYVLMEKIKIDKNRLNIEKLRETDVSGDELTGGYLFKKDRKANDSTDVWESFYPPEGVTDNNVYYEYQSPSADQIVKAQKLYIMNWMINFENIMASTQKYDSQLGYYSLLNMGSAVDYYLINELVKNYDMCSFSFFMYKDNDITDPKLHFGPVWDFNIAMGNAWDEVARSPEGWRMNVSIHPWGESLKRPFWAKLIWRDTTFRNQFCERIKLKRLNTISNQNIMEIIDSLTEKVSGAIIRNFNRWNILGTPVWPMDAYNNTNYIYNTYEEEIQYLKDWFEKRLDWIDSVGIVPPHQPTNLRSWSYPGGLALEWDKNIESDILYYLIYRSTIANFTPGPQEKIGYTAKDRTIYYDNIDLEPNQTYYYKISALDNWYNESTYSNEIASTTLDIEEIRIAKEFLLEQNYPNPFNPTTIISYILDKDSDISVSIYDVSGKLINTLQNEYRTQGEHSIIWNGTDDLGNKVGAGVYFYQLRAGEIVKTKKMVLVK